MDKDEVVAGLALINAFCKMVIAQYPNKSEIIENWEKCTEEAIKIINID